MTTCKECGITDFPTDYSERTKIKLLGHSLCFDCNFWREKVEDRHSFTIIEGNCYCILPNTNSRMRGFGGRKFIIEFFDERPTIITHNLWHQGEIPPHFRDRLQDEANFIIP